MEATKKKQWIGPKPTTCDICRRPLKVKFVDGATLVGPWAKMCTACYTAVGRGLGTGKGQEYYL